MDGCRSNEDVVGFEVKVDDLVLVHDLELFQQHHVGEEKDANVFHHRFLMPVPREHVNINLFPWLRK